MIDLNELGHLPAWLTGSVVAVLTISLLVGIPLARKAGARAAQLARPEQGDQPASSKDRLALFAALAPSILVWLAVMGVSFIGLTGFAAAVMKWQHWTNILVPLSLDGISVSFGGWAFVAVKRGRHPGRAYKIVLAAASISSLLNFVHGKDEWSIWAGIYLAFLSFAGMAMFHEMLDQFMASYDDELALKARYPRFGQRWFYAPWSTWWARRAWIVYPPAEGTRPTVNNALAHWAAVKRTARAQRMELYNLKIEEQQSKAQASQKLRDATLGLPEPATHTGLAISLPPAAASNGHMAQTAAALALIPKQSGGSSSPAAQARIGNPAGAQPQMSNADFNAAAEDLWIAAMKDGVELSGTKLLERFRQRFPSEQRQQRWAVSRCQAARTRLAQEQSAAGTVAS
ncbi:MAG TPA: hypothetical protein DGG94_17870 [Micromonosporaceae bacterium]|nr:hypothetical protein [Micromonosporaceae bacterium]HCU51638.1 hypothetical protein [Micromonosporaceae bacterium]